MEDGGGLATWILYPGLVLLILGMIALTARFAYLVSFLLLSPAATILRRLRRFVPGLRTAEGETRTSGGDADQVRDDPA